LFYFLFYQPLTKVVKGSKLADIWLIWLIKYYV